MSKGIVREAEQLLERTVNLEGREHETGLHDLLDVQEVIRKLSAEVRRLEASLKKIDEIRNSLIGTQTVNWSAHIYPLVAALAEAGYEGESYDVAREKAKTLIEQRNDAISRAEQAESSLAALQARVDEWRETAMRYIDKNNLDPELVDNPRALMSALCCCDLDAYDPWP